MCDICVTDSGSDCSREPELNMEKEAEAEAVYRLTPIRSYIQFPLCTYDDSHIHRGVNLPSWKQTSPLHELAYYILQQFKHPFKNMSNSSHSILVRIFCSKNSCCSSEQSESTSFWLSKKIMPIVKYPASHAASFCGLRSWLSYRYMKKRANWRTTSCMMPRPRVEHSDQREASKSWPILYFRKLFPVCLAGLYLQEMCFPRTWNALAGPLLFSPCLWSPAADNDSPSEASYAISGWGWFIFSALWKQNVSSKLQLEEQSY